MINAPVRVAIAGATGRMGREIVRYIQQDNGIELGAVLSRPRSSIVGADAGQLAGIGPIGIYISDNLETVIEKFDILIDFSQPEGTLRYLNLCVSQCKGMIIGTTGFDDASKKKIRDAAQHIGIVFDANFSIGMNLVLNLLEQAALVIGNSSDIEIIEAHHRHKIDAPSGTALAMGEVIAGALGRNLKDCAIYARAGHIGDRDLSSIGFATLRAGDIIGEHSAMFVNTGERIEITHKTSSRIAFASGTLRAVYWLQKHDKGLFNMRDVLNLKAP